ncbi:uncharacterized protein ACHE_60203A [Aspergillus chevalieri]|uniref:Uncharacterized protein n=1 Tax=Aspergillus chevalieri TaxID=182096 RepID=A0A7R7ZRG9_ASPCH|nr:uncharacterized protein ACHE_60203A [Aspergillus chevalieri]BCR90317.1 hypothetical protein ACHE_60203A [Aspergillus chevalieri]
MENDMNTKFPTSRARAQSIVPDPADLSREIFCEPFKRRQDLIAQLGVALKTEDISVPLMDFSPYL